MPLQLDLFCELYVGEDEIPEQTDIWSDIRSPISDETSLFGILRPTIAAIRLGYNNNNYISTAHTSKAWRTMGRESAQML